MYAELAARDRLSFNQIAKSEFIQSSMRDKKLISHTSPETIRTKVLQFFQTAKEETKKELQYSLRDQGQRFSLTFDEWTGRNRRYVTVNVHSKDVDWFNLGMIRG